MDLTHSVHTRCPRADPGATKIYTERDPDTITSRPLLTCALQRAPITCVSRKRRLNHDVENVDNLAQSASQIYTECGCRAAETMFRSAEAIETFGLLRKTEIQELENLYNII